MGTPNALTKIAPKIPSLVKASSVAAVAKKFKVSQNSIYYHLDKAKTKAEKKNGKK